jgi:hypothetical protein
MKWILIALVSVLATLIFDLIWFKVSQAIEVEKSWRAVNEQREKEGKERWDKRNKNDKRKNP